MLTGNSKFLRLGLLIPIIFLSTVGISQTTMNSLYFMRGVPQQYQVNPAFQPDCNKFFGLPGLSSLIVKVQNSPFAMNDVVYYNEELDSMITFLHPLGDKNAFLSLLNETNFINLEVFLNMASMGFRVKKMYFTFDNTERILTQLSYPDDFLRLPILGPDSGKVYDFNNFGLDFNVFNESSIGISRKFGDKLTLGIRGKFMIGQASVNTKLFDVTFATNETSWPLHSNISINTSAPYLADYITYASLAPIDVIMGELDSINIEEPTLEEIKSMVLSPKNIGFGLDVGADYRVTKWLQLSASVIDLGKIRWRNGVVNLTNQADYAFNGLDVVLGGEEDFLQDFTDSLENTFNKFTSSQTKYSTWLPSKVYAGASLYIHPRISVGVLSRTDFYKGNVKQHFTASANLYPIRMLSTTFSYSVIDKSYKNIGLGLALKLFPFNFYLISDTGPSVAMWWNEAKYANLRIGFNMMFGCRKLKEKKAAKVDMPLID